MTSHCRMCNVREIDGIVAIVSVIRPGAANEGKKLAFTRRYQGMEPIEYPHPSLSNLMAYPKPKGQWPLAPAQC